MNGLVESANSAQMGLVKGCDARIHNPTVAENIDAKIAYYASEIERLKAVKAKLEAGDIAAIPINDLRNAMSY